ncbi:MAG: hypothetical protein EOS63_16740 [Mesorhizobium sp.]|nr:MAG: hypothetical protein EOS63_16740 [Mesorhizobium sp.]TIT10664.1 MAG: hypothetical protein E5W74_15765 [Mesorhizobium sp.]TIV12076.1 MAG: hypothetical protein E5V94_01665 [Mesorhizobium sp.]TJW59711.1 MAG: hypothetical protein E5V97_26810 [Mesorhizobium sp.]
MAIGSIFSSEKRFDRRRHQGDVRRRAVLSPPLRAHKHKVEQGRPAMDLIVLGIGILFFALSLAYVKACDRI